jgi:hypothetical protein
MPARAAAMLAVMALTAGAGGCDADDDRESGGTGGAAKPTPGARDATPAEAKAVRAVVVRVFKTSDVRVICERSLTTRLFGLIYADRAACRKAAADDEGDEPPKRVEVSEIETRDRKATAQTRLIGGDSAGATGVVSLAKGSDGWRVDDLSTAFLRSLTEAGLRNDEDVPRAAARCIDDRLTRLSDEQFKRLAYGLLGRKPRATARLLELWSECERGQPGVSSLRRPLEKNLVDGLRRRGASGKVTACVIRRLRSTLPDKLLIELSTSEDRGSRARLTREVLAAAIACGFRPRQGDPGRLSPA